MKLHYVALRKDMFLIHGHFIYTNFEVKGFFFFQWVGGVSSLPDGINGVSGIGGSVPLGSPIIST